MGQHQWQGNQSLGQDAVWHVEQPNRVLHAVGLSSYSASAHPTDLVGNANEVAPLGGAGDGGIDLYVDKGYSAKAVVQCKRYKPETRIGPGVVRELVGAMTREGVTEGYLVTTARFTAAACKEASSAPNCRIRLIDGEKLVQSAHQADFGV